VVLLSVEQSVLRQRLLARGRESVDEIDARLARNAQFTSQLLGADPGVVMLDNSGVLTGTVARLLHHIDREGICV
jgi:ribose 1,5-bisphosphokinase